MRIATWNVNSIRSRVDRVAAWLERAEVDVLAIQETKSTDATFPFGRFEELGYAVAHHGVNQWNGVAIASRVGLDEVTTGFAGMPTWGEPPIAEPRAIGATCAGMRLWSVYVPNGRALDDPHLDYKLTWLQALAGQVRQWSAADLPLAVMGDFNIAPHDEDVWSMEYFAERTHVSPAERAAFRSLLDSGLQDVVRPHAPGPGTYTYWDYQRLRFPKRQGMRIDFVLGSASFAARVAGAAIDREERKGTGASDHAPVVVEVTT